MYFEGIFFSLGWVMLFLSLFLFLMAWYIGLISAFLGYLFVSTHYRLSIDPSNQEIEDYLFILGLKTEKEIFQYKELDCVFITATKYNQQLNHQSISTNVKGVLFKAYLKTEKRKIYLGENRSLKQLESKISPITSKLKLEIRTP
ncbi:hypothetical protein SAMN05421640_2992 [Ekhidna lutea]|uniref:Uncharacterized protein n=1 Tax=Ekhidna lutea TaxID=447679 RepID=A0A239L544_EKHLU|nr:hypothetical protein [Ekhidna lutea]SNT25737.1 hypothetical protein SAMN05421640_2992 [Ekhidna lutea]